MENYWLFVLVAILTVASPGPGVVLTLTNTLRFGVKYAVGGILGIAAGTFIVAGISATSLGVLLATSAIAFSVVKFVGAAYLIYLGIKLWRSAPPELHLAQGENCKSRLQFLAGLLLQLTNPKAVFFFLSVFPQFIDFSTSQFNYQFFLLVVTYSSLVIMIHFAYACLAKKARTWLCSKSGGRRINRIGGGTFMCFGLGLASASK